MLVILSVLCGALGVVVFVLSSALWSLTRLRLGKWTTLDAQDSDGERFAEMVANLTLGTLSDGNSVKLLENGDPFFDALHEAIASARDTVHFETFLWKSGALSATLVEAFSERARAGVEVRMVIDGEGGKELSPADRARLQESGVNLRFFHLRRWRNIGTYNRRDHRKLVVVDGCRAFIGGHCVADGWMGNAEDREHHRDISAVVVGPVVNHIQAVFAEHWTEVTGELLAGEKYFPTVECDGPCRAHVASMTFERRVSAVMSLYILAIASAKRSITIQNPYFIPDDGAAVALKRAVERGVRVRVMTPASATIDSGLVFHAMRHGLRPILASGVEVFGYVRTFLHQKVITVDGHWSIVGSTNFDFRSFKINHEASLSVFDEELARTLQATFEADLQHCKPYTTEMLDQRTAWDRFRDWIAWQLRAQL